MDEDSSQSEDKFLLYDIFSQIKELGRGGMGRVLLVRAERNSPGFKDFVASAIAWHEVNEHKQIRPLRKKISEFNKKIRKLTEEETELMDEGEDETAGEKREEIEKRREELDAEVDTLKKRQEYYIDVRSDRLTDADEEAMIKHLEKIGLPWPEGDVFAMKQVLMDDEKYLSRLQDEFKSLKLIQHENVLSVYSVGENYYVMEYIQSIVDVDRIIPSPELGDEGFTNEQRINIIIETCKAVEEAHRFDVIHRDIKPENIAVYEDGSVKLMDFGLAKSVETEGLTQNGTAVGTPNYMCLEQIRSTKDASPTFDIYALGATLYYFCTGMRPFERARNKYTGKEKITDSSQDVFLTVADVSFEPIPPSEIAAGIPTVLDEIILKAMAKEKKYRYQSVKEFREDLEKYLTLENKEMLSSSNFIGIKSTDLKMHIRQRRARMQQKDQGEGLIAGLNTMQKITIGVLAGMVIILGMVLFSMLKETETAKRTGHASQETGQDDGKEQDKRPGKELEKMYMYIQKWVKEHPDDYDGAIEKYSVLKKRAKGTAWEFQIQDRINKLNAAKKDKAENVFAEIMEKARKHADSGDYEGAISVCSEIPEKFEKILKPKSEEAVRDFHKEASGKISAAISSAEDFSKKGEPERGLEELAGLSGITYSALRPAIEKMRERLLKEKKSVEEEAAQQAEKQAQKAAAEKMKGIWKAFDEKLFAVDYKGAAGIIAEGKQEKDIRKKQHTRLDQLSGLLTNIKNITEKKRKAKESLTKLENREMELHTSEGTIKGRIKKIANGVIYISVPFTEGDVTGMRIREIPIDKLTQKQRNELIPEPVPENTGEWLAQSVIEMGLFQTQKDKLAEDRQAGMIAQIESCLDRAKENGLAPHYRRICKAWGGPDPEACARETWEKDVKPHIASKYDREKGKALIGALDEFSEEYGRTEFAKSKEQEIAQLKAEVLKGTVRIETPDNTVTVKVPKGAAVFRGTGEEAKWSDAANWSTGSVPDKDHVAVFDGTSVKDCIIDTDAEAEGLIINGGYTGTVTLKERTDLTVGMQGFTQGGGTFRGGNGEIYVKSKGKFSLYGGAFISTSGTMKIGQDFIISGGRFSHNSGKILFNHYHKILNIGKAILNDIEFDMGTYSVNLQGTIDVDGDLTISAVGGITGGIIKVAGDVTAVDSYVSGHDTAIEFDGTGDQTLGAHGGRGCLCAVTVNKTGGTLTIKDTVVVAGNWTYMRGKVDAGTSTVEFGRNFVTVNSGAMKFSNVVWDSRDYTQTVKGVMRIGGNLTITSIGALNGGSLQVEGNVTAGAESKGGDGTISFMGKEHQYVTCKGKGRLPVVRLNKRYGALILKSDIYVKSFHKVRGALIKGKYAIRY